VSETVIGALLVLSGVFLSQIVAMFQSWLDRKNKREILLRTKYEELGLLVLDSMTLTEDLMMAANRAATIKALGQVQANKSHLLALVYFPLLRQATGQYIESYAALAEAAISLYNPNDNRMLGTQVIDKPEFKKARDQHLAARKHLQDQIEFHAVTYAKS